MISLGLQKLFNRSYTIIKLSLIFWGFSLCGLLIFEIGPALLTISDLFQHNGWHYQADTLTAAWQLFRQHLKDGNLYFLSFMALLILLSFNFWYSVQLKGLLFLILDFVLAFALVFVFCTFNYFLIINGTFTSKLRNLLKLSVIEFFSNFFGVLKLLLGYAVVLFITYKFPGLILFATVPTILAWTAFSGRQWFDQLNTKLNDTD